jgi:hypothetical protein
MARHLHLVPAGEDVAGAIHMTDVESGDTNVVDLETERMRRRYRYHPSAGRAWLDDLFDEDDLDPVC